MDIIDQANETAELFLRAAQRLKPEDIPAPTGSCFNCDATLPEQQRWCDSDCRHDYFRRLGRR